MDEVKLYNVLVPVVALISDVTGDGAIRALKDALIAGGFEPYEQGECDAFESEMPY